MIQTKNSKSPRGLASALIATGMLCFGSAQAAVSLNLTAPDSLQGTVVAVRLSVSTDTELAGFNAEIHLPDGISVDSLQLGELLTLSGDFTLAFSIKAQRVRVLSWSGTDTFTGSGTILQINLLLGAELLGQKQLAFAATNPDPQVNSQHAVANANGSASLEHSFSNTSFLVFSEFSDYDNDGMPDQWEVEHGLDPLTDNAAADTDEDGYTDLEEYISDSDPNDPDSTPDIILSDGFEDGGVQ